jgi:hypothetical protein
MTPKQGDKFIDPFTKRVYVVTEILFDGSYAILNEVDVNHQILMSQEDLIEWESGITVDKTVALKERRQHPRFLVELPLEYWQTPEVIKGGLVLNLSQAGLLMQSVNEIEIGTKIMVKVYLSKDNRSDYIEGNAQIVWMDSHREEDWEGYRYGINIWRMPLDYKDRLMNYLLRFQKEESSMTPSS